MDEIPCLVIRGISDYAEAHIQDGWQQYATAAAAAYCRAILCTVDSQRHVILCFLCRWRGM
jgi:nucleoside phosphorylase